MSSYTLKVEFLDRLEHITKNIEDRVSLNTDQYNRVVRIGFDIIDLYIEKGHSTKEFPNMEKYIYYILFFLGFEYKKYISIDNEADIAISKLFTMASTFGLLIGKNKIHYVSKL